MTNDNVIARLDNISFRPTSEAELEWVLGVERAPENTNFIAQWPREQHLETINDPGKAHWIVQTEPDKRPVGYLILLGLDSQHRNLEFRRIVIAEKGKGIGRAALKLVKKVAFEQLGMHRIWLDVMAHNARAQHLYRSEGFVVEGKMRECMIVDGRFVSLLILSILEDEYDAGTP